MPEVIRGAKQINDRLLELLEENAITPDQFTDAESIIIVTPDVEMTLDYFNGSPVISIKAGGIDLGFF
jgi:hypothetical protein